MSDITTLKIEEMIGVVSRLVEVMSEEVDALRAMRARAISGLQSRKLLLTEDYERLARDLRDDRAALETVDPILRGELTDVMERLQTVVEENETALRAVTAANEKLLQAVVSAVKAKQGLSTGYAAMGGGRAASQAAISLQLDERL
ncbi:MAG: hypothetical protein ACTS3R_15235 [Inquilinaceae bacterium]